jgi:hypothetical protein
MKTDDDDDLALAIALSKSLMVRRPRPARRQARWRLCRVSSAGHLRRLSVRLPVLVGLRAGPL